MENQVKILLAIFVVGVAMAVSIGFNSTGFAVKDENRLVRTLPSNAGVGEIFYVKYFPAEADASLEVKIEDSVAGGCEFLNSGKTFEKIIVYTPENPAKGTFEVKAPDSAGSCVFKGSYQVLNADTKPTKSFFDVTVLVG